MIESFDRKHERFFDEPNHEVRWNRLAELYRNDYGSYRVLFLVETLCLIDQWRAPTPDELNLVLKHKLDGGQVVVRIADVFKLMQPVWPLEIAKLEVHVYRRLLDGKLTSKYPFTSIRCFASALVQTWWAFETMMNDVASIILEVRADKLSPDVAFMLKEVRPSLDKSGALIEEAFYQKILERIQFIYSTLTGEKLDRKSVTWQRLMDLKNIRDSYVHRLGKEGMSGRLGDESVVINGMDSVRSVVRDVLLKTPELSERFVYRYLAYWSCGFDSPFVWDGNEGDGPYLGLGEVPYAAIVNAFGPMAGSFSGKVELKST